jgi:hypothetical protein
MIMWPNDLKMWDHHPKVPPTLPGVPHDGFNNPTEVEMGRMLERLNHLYEEYKEIKNSRWGLYLIESVKDDIKGTLKGIARAIKLNPALLKMVINQQDINIDF